MIMLKRVFDIAAAGLGLVVLLPVFVIVALAVRMSSPGPVLFRQTRVGLGGEDFRLYKFRTMTVRTGSERGSFDVGDASRVTRVGKLLRALKLDELPQLLNVLRGDMSVVGPRPEVRKWVEAYPRRWAVVHTVRPGITDPASIVYRHEESLLARAADPEALYRDVILPNKLDMYEKYVESRTFGGDLRVVWQTAVAVLRRADPPDSSFEARPLPSRENG